MPISNDRKDAVVTVVVLTKNPGLIFQDVLLGVIDQRTPWPYKILVIDSGSTDDTLDFVRRHRDVKLVQIPSSEFGHGKTRNLAVSLADTPLVAMLTHDARPYNEDWLFNLVKPALENPNIAGVFGRHFAYPGASVFTKEELELHFNGLACYPLVNKSDDEARYTSDQGWRQLLHFFSDNNALLRRSVWELIPYPEVDFAEDQIWAQKIIEAGWSKAYADNAAVFHSHDYSLIERLQRSFDESYALLRLFGYKLCPSVGHLISTVFALSKRDFEISIRAKYYKTDFLTVALMPLDNFMRLLGHWLGGYGDCLPDFVKNRLSRDRRLMKGLIKSASLVRNK